MLQSWLWLWLLYKYTVAGLFTVSFTSILSVTYTKVTTNLFIIAALRSQLDQFVTQIVQTRSTVLTPSVSHSSRVSALIWVSRYFTAEYYTIPKGGPAADYNVQSAVHQSQGWLFSMRECWQSVALDQAIQPQGSLPNWEHCSVPTITAWHPYESQAVGALQCSQFGKEPCGWMAWSRATDCQQQLVTHMGVTPLLSEPLTSA